MPRIHIHSIDDERLKPFGNMRDAILRQWPGMKQGLFAGESVKVIERAMNAGVELYALLIAKCLLEKCSALLARIEHEHLDIPVFVVDDEQFRQIAGFEIVRAPIAIFVRPKLPDPHALLFSAHRIAVLEDIGNYTNIGAIFRNAAALGIDAVLVTPGCHDPLYRRASRVSMGTVFQVPWTRIGKENDWVVDGVRLLHDTGFKLAAFALDDDSTSLDNPALKSCDKLAIVLGSEGDGLAYSSVCACDWTVRIPMKHGVDSLNVASASAIAFWELCKR